MKFHKDPFHNDTSTAEVANILPFPNRLPKDVLMS